jgi:two-component system chemotaxis response regulator CheB
MDISNQQKRKKLFIIDDSKMMRKIIADIFADDELIEVIGEASDGEEALQILPQVNADVVTLDVQMPVMDGLTTLKHMMIQTPVPTVMLSAFTQEGAAVTFDALKYGAVDFVSKPSNVDAADLRGQAREVAKKVHLAAGVEIEAARYIRVVRKKGEKKQAARVDCRTIVAIGVAEGGYGTLLKIIPHLSPDLSAAYLVVFYASPKYVDAFVNYLNDHSAIEVKRAVNNDPIEGGVCYIASGEEYLTVQQEKGHNVLHVCPAPFATQKGSINMLMFSVAEMMKDSSLGIILTGLGNDGVEGMAEIIRVGGKALVQDPRGCLYRTMPEAALAEFKEVLIIADTKIAAAVNELLHRNDFQ